MKRSRTSKGNKDFTNEVFVVKTAIVHFFFEIEIKYDSKGKFHAENDGNIGFL